MTLTVLLVRSHTRLIYGFTPAEVDENALPKFGGIGVPKLVRIPCRSRENTAIGTGDCEEVLLMSRGIGGLYDLVPAAQQEKILNALGTTLDKIPEVPLAESSSTGRGISRDEARERARANRQARRNSRAVSPAVAVEQPE